ncbi:MAG: hypothetical protein ACOY31_06610 [Bacillota bacterium]
MDQVIQLQQQIQRLQQEINDITQVCNQLQQSEQSNAIQLQQMTQKELLASQGLRRIQQTANQLSQEVSQISNITSQIVGQIGPLQRTLQSTGVFPGYATQAGLTTQIPTTGVMGGLQYGAFSQGTSQLGWNQGLTNIGQAPGINLNTFTSQLHPYSQSYNPGVFSTGNQPGYSSQAFSSPMSASNLGLSSQGLSQGLMTSSPLGTSAMSPMMQSQSGAGLISYSPYQANQFGFR